MTPQRAPKTRPRSFLLPLLGLLAALFCVLPRDARAFEPLVVLDLDGYGVSYDNLQVMTQALRDAFLEEGTYEPLDGYRLSDRLMAGHEAEIRRARELLSQARQKSDAGRSAEALKDLGEVLRLHGTAWSAIAARPELADAHYFTALALLKAGRNTEAVDHLVEVLYFYPDYDRTRAPNAPQNIRPLLSQARATLSSAEKRNHSSTEIAAICRILSVGTVVSGRVTADGTVNLFLHKDGRLAAEAADTAPSIPLEAGHPFYQGLVSALVGSQPSSGPAPSVRPVVAAPEDFHELPTLDPASTSSSGGSGGLSELDDRDQPRRGKTSGRIRATGSIRVHKSIHERWWFWTAIGVAAVGGGYVIYTQIEDPEPTVIDTPARHHYRVVVDTSGL